MESEGISKLDDPFYKQYLRAPQNYSYKMTFQYKIY